MRRTLHIAIAHTRAYVKLTKQSEQYYASTDVDYQYDTVDSQSERHAYIIVLMLETAR